MRNKRWKAVLVFAGLFLLALQGGCGKKTESEKMSVVLTVAETTGEARESSAETPTLPARVDVVNGFRFEPCDEMVYCIGEGVKLRKKPGKDGEVAGYMHKGKYVHRIGRNAKWSRLLWNGKRLYAAAEYLSPYPPETEAAEETLAAEETPDAEGTEAAAEASAAKKTEKPAETEAAAGTE